MKKWVLILLMLLLTLPGYALITIEKKPGTGTLSGHLDDINANDLELDGKIDGKVSDDAFTADWAEVTDVAPSQAALYNYLINFDADGDGLFSDEAWFPLIFDPAAPGEIGGTTPAAGTFTDLTADTLALTSVDGENRLTFPDNTTRSPTAGAQEIYSEGGLMKYSENGVEKNFVTIDDTAGTGDTAVTLSADKIAEYIAGVSGAAGYVAPPTYSDSTGTTGQYSWDADYYYICTATNTWDRFAITRANWNNPTPDLVNPEIAITTPAADGGWSQSASFSADGTASDNVGVQDIYWKLESGGTYVNTGVTGTTTWSISGVTLAEGANNFYVRARDAATNASEAIRTRNIDTIDPAIGTVTPDPATHDGTGTAIAVAVASITETNESAREYQIYNVTDAAVTEAYQSFTGLTINETLPADQDTYRIDVRVTDLSGRTGTASSANIAYSAGATSETLRPNGGGTTSWTTYDAAAYPAHNTYMADQSDVTYVYTSTSSTYERHAFADCTLSGTVASVTLHIRASSTTPGDILRLLAMPVSTSYYSGNQTMTADITEYSYTWVTNPATSSAWAISEINSATFGVRSEAGSGQRRCYDMWIVVAYE